MTKKILLLTLMTALLPAKEAHYDIGIGGIVVTYPTYMGSKTTRQLITPLPYFNYEGEKTTIERGNIERKLFDIQDLTLDISMGGSLPSDSEHSQAREGMEDLDLAFEIGPRLKYQLHQHHAHTLLARLPLRAVFTTDFSDVDYQGYLITPDLRYEYETDSWEVSLNTGPLWASEAYHGYFYSVAPHYATPSRQAYQAKAGYSGYRNSMGIKYKHNSWVYGGFVAHFTLDGATVEDSPLVETNSALFTGAYVSYIFYSH